MKDLINYINIIEEQEKILKKKKKSEYSSEDLNMIQKLVKSGKEIKDKRLLELYLKLKEAGLFT